jgi:hypothetical protein
MQNLTVEFRLTGCAQPYSIGGPAGHFVANRPTRLSVPTVMPGNDEKRVHHLAERKGFRLEKMGPVDDRYHILDLASGGKMPSDAPGHPTPLPSMKRRRGWKLAEGASSGTEPGE